MLRGSEGIGWWWLGEETCGAGTRGTTQAIYGQKTKFELTDLEVEELHRSECTLLRIK